MSRIGDMVRRGKKYQPGTKIKFRTTKGGQVKGKIAKSKTYKPGTHIKLKVK